MARFCAKCGAPLKGYEKFCGACGRPVDAPLEGERSSEVPAYPPVGPSVAKSATPGGKTSGQQTPGATVGGTSWKQRVKKRVKTPLIVAFALAIVVVVAVDVAVLMRQGVIPNPFGPQSLSIGLKLEAPGYNEETDSKIPLEVRGATARGEAYDETFYVLPSRPRLEVPAGAYELSLPASPLMETGAIYTMPEPITLNVQGGDNGGAAVAVTLAAKPAKDVTKEDIDAAKAAAQASGFDGERSESLATAVVRRQLAGLYGEVLDNIRSVDFAKGGSIDDSRLYYKYVLQDINADGVPDLLAAKDQGCVQTYCLWVGSPDGSGLTKINVSDDMYTRYGYPSSFRFILAGSNEGNGLLHSSISNSGASIPTTHRYVVKGGELVADGREIQSQVNSHLAPEVLAESVELNFTDASDRSALDAFADSGSVSVTDGDGQQPQGQAAQSADSERDEAIADAQARGFV